MNDKFDKNGLIAKFRNQFKTPQQKSLETIREIVEKNRPLNERIAEAIENSKPIEEKFSDAIRELNYPNYLIKEAIKENKSIGEKIKEFINDFKIRHHEDSEYYYTEAYSPSTKEKISLKSNRHYKLGALLAEILMAYFKVNRKLNYQMTSVVKGEILNEFDIIENEGHSNNLKYENSKILTKKTESGFGWRNTDKGTPKEQQFNWKNLKNALTKPKKEIKDQLKNLNTSKH